MRCGRREISKGKRGCAALLTVLLTFSRSTFFDPRRSSQRPRDCSWMARFQRPAIQANIGAETARLDEPLRTVVASLAERLERAEPEFVDVAAMCLDVITDLSRRYDAALEVERAEGVLASTDFRREGLISATSWRVVYRSFSASSRNSSGTDREGPNTTDRVVAGCVCHTPDQRAGRDA